VSPSIFFATKTGLLMEVKYMIIGADKERVRKLEVEVGLAREFIEHLRKDLETIGEALKKEESIDRIGYPYYKIYDDIGRCDGYLESFK
jgi:hypothetical protein